MTTKRENSIEMSKAEFQKIGYELIDTISEFFDVISEKPVTTT
ncbi:MAG: aromatic-L-amino-acid decarboxylase, partial [Cryomorphaceae bacterium]